MARQDNATSGAGDRPKVDEGVVRRSAERSFSLWSDAPTSAKERYLLSGPTLSWVEGHMIAHPEEYTIAYRKFVTVSASQRAGETAVGRARFDDDERRAERRVRLMFFTAAALALLHASSGQLKPALEAMINGSEHSTVAVNRGGTQKAGPAGLAVVQPSSSSKVVMSTHRDPITGETIITTIAEPKQPKPVVVSESSQKTERERMARLVQHHASLADQRSEQGDKRVALQLAAEAFQQSEVISSKRSKADEVTGASDALSALYRGLGSASRGPEVAARPIQGLQPLICGGRYLLSSQDGVMRLVDRATGNVEDAKLATGIGGRVAATDATCSIAAVLAEDYAVKLVPLSPGGSGVIGVLHGHESDILSVAFSPDASLVATASLDASLRVWDVRTGRRLALMAEHAGAVIGVRFSADGKTLLSWGPDKTARLWAMPSGKSLAVLGAHVAGVLDAQFSPDGQRVLTTSLDGHARIFDAKSGAHVATLQSERSSIALSRFSPDGTKVALVTHEGDIEIWSLAAAKSVAVRRDVTEDPARDLTISPDGRWLIVTSWTGRVMLIATDLGGDIVELNRESQIALHAAIEADGRSVAALAANGTMHRWPLYAGHGEAVTEAIRIAGACLTRAERDELGVGAATPSWCDKPVKPAKP